MKKKREAMLLIRRGITITFAAAVFFSAGFFYLTVKTEQARQSAEAKEFGVPYSSSAEPKGLLCLFPDGSAALMYLDFPNECIYAALIEEHFEDTYEYYGYPSDFSVSFSYSLIGELIDRIGGIDYTRNTSAERLCGAQIIEYLSETPADEAIKKQLISAVFKSISKNGFPRENLVCIIENGNTTLTLPDCFDWSEALPDMAHRVTFVN